VTVEEAVIARLVGHEAVDALVSGRVWNLILPESPALPAVRVQLVDAPASYHLRGGSLVDRSRVQVDAYAGVESGGDPYAGAVAVADAVHTALSGAPFSIGSPAIIAILGAFRETRMPLYEPGALRLVRILQDYFIWARTTLES
jgi:uncharacterized protein DUF3168